MASSSGPARSLDHDIDLEAQEVAAQVTVSDMQKALAAFLGTSEMHETSIPRPDATNDSGEAPTVTSEQTVNIETQPAISESPAEGAASGSGIHETEINQSELHDRNRQSRGQAEQNETHQQTEAHHDPDPQNNPPVDSNPRGGGSDQEPEEKRMIGDFDGSANQLWTLYGKEAKSHDESRIRTLKEDMDGVLIFAGLFSAALTAFIIDSKQALKPAPSDKMTYYLQQNVEILSRISQQISTIAPQVTIPSTPPPPFPTTFSPSTSDVRVNAFWFMSLVFSLSAALVAILVQQWVRDYMHVFQRYSDPLKSARLRQYLYEGSKGWYMPVVAESVPGLLHLSLFLFFLGLGDLVSGINTTVGITTIIPILICAALYIFTTFAPALYPQSPYQTSFSVLIWYTIQKLRVRRYQDRDGEMKSVSANMAQGQMQLAMEETEGRTERDAKAIRWLVHNLTEEAEMESLIVAIPGSFNVEWGTKVWKRVSEVVEDENGNSSTAITPVGRSPRINLVRSVLGSILHPVNMRTEDQPIAGTMVPLRAPHLPDISRLSNQEDNIVRDLSMRIVPLLDKCKNRGLFASDEQWRRRTRGCIETIVSLVFSVNAKLDWFGDIGKLLRDIGMVENVRELCLAGTDQSFVTRWTCLSILVTRSMLNGNLPMQPDLREAISFMEAPIIDGVRTPVDKIDTGLSTLWGTLILISTDVLSNTLSEEGFKEILHNHKYDMSWLEKFYEWRRDLMNDRERDHDQWGSFARVAIPGPGHSIYTATHELICELPGFQMVDQQRHPTGIPFSLAVDLLSNPEFQFIRPELCIEGLSSIFPRLQDILQRQGAGKYQETIDDLMAFWRQSRLWEEGLMQRQLSRFHDLCSGGGLGFTVELFLIALKQLLSASYSNETQSELYIGTFRAITSDWSEHKHCLATQKILLHAIVSRSGLVSKFNYPSYMTEELLVLVDNMFKGQTGPHIEYAMEQLRQLRDPKLLQVYDGPPDFPARALGVLSQLQRARAASSSS